MATIACKQFLNQLDSWLEGERGPGARAHWAACPECRALVEDFDAITLTARDLGADASEPPRYLWTSIRSQLAREGVIRDRRAATRPAQAPSKGWAAWLHAWPRPALATAGVALLLALGIALSHPLNKRMNDYRWMRHTQPSTSSLGAHLDSVEHATVASLRSRQAVSAVLNKNLAIVDNYIALCEKSVRENPESEMARDYLYDAYQQKANLLAQISDGGE
jgi:hypothetical protein